MNELGTMATISPFLGVIIGFFAGYFFKDQIGRGILAKSKFFTEAFAGMILIAIIYVFYILGVFSPIIAWFNS